MPPAAGIPMWGLSPRVRGNLAVRHRFLKVKGSIPACAGEPRRRRRSRYRNQVYPRVCGGTAVYQVESNGEPGLSPRVRGNHHPGVELLLDLRSIPACAGEPTCSPAPFPVQPVYPRVCGGTPKITVVVPAPFGLSPRVRGNPNPLFSPLAIIRSIPACAGEPVTAMVSVRLYEVYPRVCGGTCIRTGFRRRRLGLSPRVRGNQILVIANYYVTRSIPACAGEPRTEKRRALPHKVYPRVCGGTIPLRTV